MDNLYKKLPYIMKLDKKRRLQFETYFRSAPDWVLDTCQIVPIKKDTILVQENTPVDTIYFVVSGKIKAVDYRVLGIAYDFMRFDDVYAFGGTEVLTRDEVYRTTLQTTTDCMVLKMPRSIFEHWLDLDPRVLRIEAGNVASYLLEQARKSRACLFLQGSDRLAYILLDMYEHDAKNGVLTVKMSQNEFAELCGVSVKTVYRSLKRFEELDWISRKGNYFTLDKKQYEDCTQYMSDLVFR